MLVQITRAAAQRKIIYAGATTLGLWDDVIDLQGRAACGFGIATVLTAIAGAACNLGAMALRRGHGQASTPYSSGQALEAFDFEGIGFRHQGVPLMRFVMRQGPRFADLKERAQPFGFLWL
jgi:hypothetical protein